MAPAPSNLDGLLVYCHDKLAAVQERIGSGKLPAAKPCTVCTVLADQLANAVAIARPALAVHLPERTLAANLPGRIGTGASVTPGALCQSLDSIITEIESSAPARAPLAPELVCATSTPPAPPTGNNRGTAKEKRGRTAKADAATKPWLTVSEAEKASGIPAATISRLATAGKLKSNGKVRRARRINSADLNRYTLEKHDRTESPTTIQRKLANAQQPRK